MRVPRSRVWPPYERKRAVWWNIVEENERPWEPLPGMVKRRCVSCELWYAQRLGAAAEHCPDCALSHGL